MLLRVGVKRVTETERYRSRIKNGSIDRIFSLRTMKSNPAEGDVQTFSSFFAFMIASSTSSWECRCINRDYTLT